MIRDKLFLSVALLIGVVFVPGIASAQTGQISGTVTDSLTGEPIPGVNVGVVGTTQGAATGTNGAFTITDIEPGTYELEASFVGYATKTENVNVEAGETTEVKFQLIESALQLDEVVAVAYGEQERQSVTGSVSSMDMGEVDTKPINSAAEALQGQMAGVNVQAASGIPGGGPSITVRGTGNVGAGGQPLYVIDGFALPQTGQGSVSRQDPLAELSPDDIENITVLKGASASALYGSRASNGVVLIETESGTSGQFEFNVSASSGWNQVWDRDIPDPATARQFAEFQNFIWSDRVEQGTASEVPEEYRNPDQYGEGTNWWDAITRTARRNRVNVSASGGTDQFRSYFSGGVTSEEGLMTAHDFTRISGRANVEADVTEDLNTSLRIAPTFTEQNLNWGGTGRGGPGGAPWMLCPLESVRNDDGSLNTQPGEECTGVWSHPNPVQWLQQEKNVDEALRLITSASAEYEFLPGLSVKSQFNVDSRSESGESFRPSTLGGINSPPPSTPTGSESSSRYINWLSETTLNYQEAEVGPGDIDVVAGFTAQQQTEEGSFFSGEFPNDGIQTLNVASQIDGGSNEQEWSLLSGLGRVNYTLFGKYVLTGSFRADGSSRFGADKRWGYFPSAAFAWNVHEESFMEDVSGVSELRLRGSWGVTGNNQIGNYASLGVVGEAEYVLGGNSASGRTLNSMTNNSLSWERTVEWNLGIDAVLYEGLELELNLYQRNTTDLLIDRELPMTAGFGGVTQNTGELQNRGVEVSLSTTNVERENFRWTSNVDFSLNRNEVTSLPGGKDIRYTTWPAEYLHREGQPMGSYVGFVFDGLYTSEEEVQNHEASFPGSAPGTMRWRDLNGDGTMTEDVMEESGGDYRVLGDANPDFSFSFNNSVRIGDFDVRATITGNFGSTNLRTEWITTYRNIDGLFNVDADYVENFWRSRQNPGDGLTPTPIGGATPRQQYRDTQHSIFLWDASHIWLRDLSVRYHLGGTLEGTSIYASGSNLLLISPYPGNPEATDLNDPSNSPGRDDGNYPVSQTLTVGINFSF